MLLIRKGWVNVFIRTSLKAREQLESAFELICLIWAWFSQASSISSENLLPNSTQSLDLFLIFSLSDHVPFLD